MRVDTDKRSREVEPAPEADRAVRVACGVLRETEVDAALGLATIEKARAYLLLGYPTVHAYAAGVGYAPQQARRLLALGRVLTDVPDLAGRVRRGRVAAESAIALGRILREPGLRDQLGEWLARIENSDPRAFREAVDRAIEEARQGAPTFPLRFHVTREAKTGFHRIRHLLSLGQPLLMSEGHTFGRIVDDWLSLHDPKRLPLPARRRGPTANTKDRRIPRRVRAIIEGRSGGTCEICGDARAREFIHIKPHSRGGGREAEDLSHACRECHFWVDVGVYVCLGFDEDGRPRWAFDPARMREVPGRRRGTGTPEEVRERGPRYAASTPLPPRRGTPPRRGVCVKPIAPPGP